MARVEDKVVLVTGGARGMGAAHAEALVAEGARVVIGDILDDAGRRVAEKLGDAATFVHLDVTELDLWEQAVAASLERFGG
jgi:3alpha(or 20beta)-hydroxysteroid dehydrogenase